MSPKLILCHLLSFRLPNAFGLYDMHGNVWEWCLDDWHNNYEGAPIDGSAWLNENDNLSSRQQKYACLRGGSWNNYPGLCRSSSRNNDFFMADRDNFSDLIGFRVACGVGRIIQ